MGAALKLPPPSEETRVTLKEVYTSKREKYKPANMLKRMVAYAVDTVITILASSVVSILIINKIFESPALRWTFGLSFFWVAVPLAYWGFLTMKYGATPGKKMMGLKVVREDHSHNVTVQNIFLRETVGRALSGGAFFSGYISAFSSAEKVTWHDKMSKTRVVEFK